LHTSAAEEAERLKEQQGDMLALDEQHSSEHNADESQKHDKGEGSQKHDRQRESLSLEACGSESNSGMVCFFFASCQLVMMMDLRYKPCLLSVSMYK
jgi:hypothetical protein